MIERESQQQEPVRVWILSALGAIVIHIAAVAATMAYLQDEPDERALGAPAIEIDVELAAPRAISAELMPGPEAQASAASAAVTAQKAVVKPSELSKAAPTETDDPDRVVAPNSVERPVRDPNLTSAQATPSDPTVASLATATPSPQSAKESLRSTAPEQGIGESTRRIRVTWEKELAAHLDKYKRYPSDRSEKNAQLVVSFELNRDGHILSASIVRGSGDASFDEAALTMMRRADPVPPPPPLIADEGLTFTLPVIFRVKK